jgi:DNA-binding NarL/FixJ family response regulator
MAPAMDPPIRVLIVEDDPRQRESFADSIAAHPALELVGMAPTLEAGLTLFDRDRPDVLLVDLDLPDGRGTTLIRHALATHPACNAVVLTVFTDDENVVDCLAAGATGFVAKDALPSDLARVVLEVHAGGAPVTPAIARRVLQRFRVAASPAPIPEGQGVSEVPTGSARDGSDGTGGALSAREIEVLSLSAKGLSYPEIAGLLGVSLNTVTTYVKRIFRKLEVRSRGEAVFEARQVGLI